jgi:KUP system potassium uptake protein
MHVRHTSEQTIGQVYVPAMNWILLVAVVVTVLGFRSSGELAGAYGVAVTGTMTVDTLLAFTFFWLAANWPLWQLVPIFTLFLAVDLSFFGANLLKIEEGGWFPLTIGGVLFTVMMTWWRGRRLLAELRARDAMPLREFVEGLKPEKPGRVPGTAIFMSRDLNRVPVALLHALKHYKVLHERVVIMQVDTQDVPHVPDEQRLEIAELGKGFFTIRVRYGFMDEPNVLRALAQCRVGGFRFNLMETSFIIGREKLRLRPRVRRARFWRWRDALFILMSNNTLDATEFFRIPPNRVVELGGQVEI